MRHSQNLEYELVASPLVVQVSGTKENAVSIAILPSKWLFRGAKVAKHGTIRMRSLMGLLAALSVLFGLAQSPALADDKTLTIFAAASLKNALDDIDAAFTAKTGVKIVSSYAASSVLAKQIEQDGPVDIFASADTDWMDYAVQKKTVKETTRVFEETKRQLQHLYAHWEEAVELNQ